MDIKEKLDRLSDLQVMIELDREYYNKLRREALPEDLRTALDKIDLEFTTKQAEVGKEIAELETEIKREVLFNGLTVKGNYLMAVWNKGRISWDTKGLDGYAVAHPEMTAFRKEGDPSVTIRKA
jgi:hypothetical protein